MDTGALAALGLRLLGIYHAVHGLAFLVLFVDHDLSGDAQIRIPDATLLEFVTGSIIVLLAPAIGKRFMSAEPGMSAPWISSLGYVLIGTHFLVHTIVDLPESLQRAAFLGPSPTLAQRLLPVIVQGSLAAAFFVWARPLGSRVLSRSSERRTMTPALAAVIGFRLLGAYFVAAGIRNLSELPRQVDAPGWFIASGALNNTFLTVMGVVIVLLARRLAARVDADEHAPLGVDRIAAVGLALIGTWFVALAAVDLVGSTPQAWPSLFASPDDPILPPPTSRWIVEELVPVLVRGGIGLALIVRARWIVTRLLGTISATETAVP